MSKLKVLGFPSGGQALFVLFGYDEEWLYQRFLKYGLEESRNRNSILDVKQYREQNADLDVARGDNWDTYVELNNVLTKIRCK